MTSERKVPEAELARNGFERVRSAIGEISDLEYQTRVWLGDLPDEISSYLDASAEILDQDERNEFIANHLNDIGLSRTQWARVMEFTRELQTFEDSVSHPYDDAEVVRHPNWNSIVRHARALLEELPRPD